jgi:hypothetical protein
LFIGAAVVFVAGIAAILVSTADSGTKAKKKLTVVPKAHTPTASTTKHLTLVIGAVNVQNAGPPATVSGGVKVALLRATQQYLDDAIQAPLHHHPVNAAYSQVFDSGVKDPATGNDRATLTESGTGTIRGAALLNATRVRIDVLGDPTGKIALAATTFALQVKANTATGLLTIHRRTELTFAKESGKWLVTAYRVTVSRKIGTKATTTTAAHTGATA